MSLVSAIQAGKLRRSVLALPCNALLCSVLVTHHLAASVVFAADHDAALESSDIKAAFVVALGESAHLPRCNSHLHLLHHHGVLLGSHLNHAWLALHGLSWHHPWLSRHHTRLHRHHAWLHRHSIGVRWHSRLTLHQLHLRRLPHGNRLLLH